MRSALVAAFGDRIVDDVDPPANYSIRLTRTRNRYHELYWGNCLELTSPDPRRVVDALLLHLDAHLGTPPGGLDFNVLALVRDGEALLVPRLFRDPLVVGRRRLEKRGWSLLDGPTVHVLPETSEVLVTRRLEIAAGGVVGLVASMPSPRRSDEGVPNGTYAARSWYFIEPFGTPTGYSRATATRIAATALSVEPDLVTSEQLSRVSTLFDRVEPIGVAPDWDGAMLPALLGAQP